MIKSPSIKLAVYLWYSESYRNFSYFLGNAFGKGTHSTVIKIKKMKFRTLVDSGAEVSLIHSRIFASLKDKPKVFKKKAHLQSVSGQAFLLNFATVLITIHPGSDETYPDSKAQISTKLVAPKLGLFFIFTGHTFTI
jgi:hypothetical protein